MNKTSIKIGLFSLLCVGLFGGVSLAGTTGSFLTSVANQKDNVLALYDSGYTRVYQKVQTAGISDLMKTLNYQSLVCLGVMKNGSFLQDMQTELKTLKTDFLNQYNTILTSYADLQQKQIVYQDTKVNLFAKGSYEKDLAALSGNFQDIVAAQKLNVVNYVSKYQQTVSTFVSEYSSYVKKNADLLSKVSTKLSLLQQISTRFGVIDSLFADYTNRLAQLSKTSFFADYPSLRASLISGFDLSLQTQLATQVKRYKVLKTLSGELLPQKNELLSGFVSYLDKSYLDLLSNWYDASSYTSIKDQINYINTRYYNGALYKCSTILTNSGFDTDMALLLKNINKVSASLGSGVSINTGNFSATGFQKKVNTWYESIQSKKKSYDTQYKTFVSSKTSSLLADYRKKIEASQSIQNSGSTLISTGIVVPQTPSPVFVAPVGFSFTEPFTNNQKSNGVGVLQGLLSSLGYYTGSISTINTQETISALYRFQLDKGLLKGYEKKPQTWGWMGPATRAALNALLK